MMHSEQNSLLNVSRSIRDYPGGVKIYVTGRPCLVCLQMIFQAGIDTIYMAKRQGQTDDESTNYLFNKIVKETNLKIIELDINNKWLEQIL